MVVLNTDNLLRFLGPGGTLILSLAVPNQGAGVDLISKYIVHIALAPVLAAFSSEPLGIEGLDDFLGSHSIDTHSEDTLNNGSIDLIRHKPRFLIDPIPDFLSLVSNGDSASIVVTPRCILLHSSKRILCKVDGIELINDLDHSLQKLSCRSIIHLFIYGITEMPYLRRSDL